MSTVPRFAQEEAVLWGRCDLNACAHMMVQFSDPENFMVNGL